MLNGAHGPAIAQIAVAGSNTQKIAQAIRRMKSNLARTTSIEDLAARYREAHRRFISTSRP